MIFLLGFLIFCPHLKAQVITISPEKQREWVMEDIKKRDQVDRDQKRWNDIMKDEMKRDINKRGNSTLSGSWDVAKTKEGGYSAIPYDGISGINVSIFKAEAIAFMLNYGGGGGGGGSVGFKDAADFALESSFDASDHYVINPSILSLSEGLQFIQKGAKEKEGGGKIKLNYIASTYRSHLPAEPWGGQYCPGYWSISGLWFRRSL